MPNSFWIICETQPQQVQHKRPGHKNQEVHNWQRWRFDDNYVAQCCLIRQQTAGLESWTQLGSAKDCSSSNVHSRLVPKVRHTPHTFNFTAEINTFTATNKSALASKANVFIKSVDVGEFFPSFTCLGCVSANWKCYSFQFRFVNIGAFHTSNCLKRFWLDEEH